MDFSNCADNSVASQTLKASAFDFVLTVRPQDTAEITKLPTLAWSSFYILGIGLSLTCLIGLIGNLVVLCRSLRHELELPAFNRNLLNAFFANNAILCTLAIYLSVPYLVVPTSMFTAGHDGDRIPLDNLFPSDAFIYGYIFIFPMSNVFFQASTWLTIAIVLERRMAMLSQSSGPIWRKLIASFAKASGQNKHHIIVIIFIYITSVLLAFPTIFEFDYRPVAVSPLQAVIASPLSWAKPKHLLASYTSAQQQLPPPPVIVPSPITQTTPTTRGATTENRLPYSEQWFVTPSHNYTANDEVNEMAVNYIETSDYLNKQPQISELIEEGSFYYDSEDCEMPTFSKIAIFTRDEFREAYRLANNIIFQGAIPILVGVSCTSSLMLHLRRQRTRRPNDSTHPLTSYTMTVACHAFFSLIICTLPTVWAEISCAITKQEEYHARLWNEVSTLIFGCSAAFSWVFYAALMEKPQCCRRTRGKRTKHSGSCFERKKNDNKNNSRAIFTTSCCQTLSIMKTSKSRQNCEEISCFAPRTVHWSVDSANKTPGQLQQGSVISANDVTKTSFRVRVLNETQANPPLSLAPVLSTKSKSHDSSNVYNNQDNEEGLYAIFV